MTKTLYYIHDPMCRRIEGRIPGVRFNFDFWTHCTPKRSTYPACRAVIAARAQDPTLDEAMIGLLC